MATGQEISIMARAARAGLTMLPPSPPKNCLTSTMAKTEPQAAIHSGMVGGRL